jgi:hypothetical protein
MKKNQYKEGVEDGYWEVDSFDANIVCIVCIVWKGYYNNGIFVGYWYAVDSDNNIKKKQYFYT